MSTRIYRSIGTYNCTTCTHSLQNYTPIVQWPAYGMLRIRVTLLDSNLIFISKYPRPQFNSLNKIFHFILTIFIFYTYCLYMPGMFHLWLLTEHTPLIEISCDELFIILRTILRFLAPISLEPWVAHCGAILHWSWVQKSYERWPNHRDGKFFNN